jgi:hypothetical protein
MVKFSADVIIVPNKENSLHRRAARVRAYACVAARRWLVNERVSGAKDRLT